MFLAFGVGIEEIGVLLKRVQLLFERRLARYQVLFEVFFEPIV